MENIFDSLKLGVFDAVAQTMGVACLWRTYSATVLYKDPTESEKLGGTDYNPRKVRIEYKINDFPGLKDAVDESGAAETILIKGLDYYVRSVEAAHDGDCYIALLENAH